MNLSCNDKGFGQDKIPEFKRFHSRLHFFKLNFSRNTFADLPPNLLESIDKNICILDLSQNRSTNVPFALKNFTDLLILDLKKNYIDLKEKYQFPNLLKLIKLDLSDKNIRKIKDVFCGLKGLKYIYLDNNYISNISSAIFLHSPLLTYLGLSSNLLPGVPHLGTLLFLKNINLSGNLISALQNTSFLDMLNVETITVSGNNLQYIHPNTFSDLKELKIITLVSCQLTSLPGGLLSGLPVVKLKIDDNHLTDSDLLVDAIMGSRLQVISMKNNNFTHITPRLCQYLNFRLLYAAANPIEDVPSVTSCTNLISLGIMNTKITTIHEYQFKGLRHFRRLWWGGSPFHCDCRIS